MIAYQKRFQKTETPVTPAMMKRIRALVQDTGRKNNVRILFAVENGSRAWRMESADSDYDVRFVFYRPYQEYVKLRPPADVIVAAFDAEGKPHQGKGALIDFNGFDIFKFLRLLGSSNPACIEWLTSDIVYYGRQPPALQRFARQHFNPAALYYHYASMCRANYLRYLKSGSKVTYKKYLYAYRGLVNAKWVAHRRTVPPIIFSKALDGMEGVVPPGILRKLADIIRLKTEGRENDITENIVSMDEYIESFLKNAPAAPAPRQLTGKGVLERELQKIVLGAGQS